jgi:hypothetical protein
MIWFIVGGWCEKNNQWYKIFFYDWEMRDERWEMVGEKCKVKENARCKYNVAK